MISLRHASRSTFSPRSSLSSLLLLSALFSSLTHAQANPSGDNGMLGSGAISDGSSSGSGSTNQTDDTTENHTLWVIVLVVVVVLVLGVVALFTMRRRRRALASSRARAARDLEAQRMQRGLTGWRTAGSWNAATGGASGFPMMVNTNGATVNAVRIYREEGLDENGEAPPPYTPPSKDRILDKELNVTLPSADAGAQRTRRDSDASTQVGSPVSPISPVSPVVARHPAGTQAPGYEEVARPEPAHAR